MPAQNPYLRPWREPASLCSKRCHYLSCFSAGRGNLSVPEAIPCLLRIIRFPTARVFFRWSAQMLRTRKQRWRWSQGSFACPYCVYFHFCCLVSEYVKIKAQRRDCDPMVFVAASRPRKEHISKGAKKKPPQEEPKRRGSGEGEVRTGNRQNPEGRSRRRKSRKGA